MADGLNKILLLGNLGADPELKVTPSGQAILKLRLATSESYLDKQNVRQERTEWHSCTVWGKRGEALAKILTKGSKIFIEGSLRTSSYEKDGEKRYRTEVNVNNVLLCGGGPGGDRAGAGGDRNSQHANRGGGTPPAGKPEPQDEYQGGFEGDDEIPF